MSTFSDSLKKWFYHNDSFGAKAGTRICLLDANGNPAGSDEILRAITFVNCKDDYVDMGLPSKTLWAKKNLGAVSETDYGMYCSWGNLELHARDEGYSFSADNYNNTQAAAISADLTLDQDIAHQTLGCGWRMPTTTELKELFDNTTKAWVTDYQGISGLNGRLLTATNGNTLFFPAAGHYDGTTLAYNNTIGYYWSSSLVSSTNAYVLYFTSSFINTQNDTLARRYGFSIRPVI